MKQITGPSIAKLDGRYVLVDDRWLDPPVEDWYDPAGGLPADPSVGDRYIAETTANGWTQDYIYEWDGDEWIESVPEEGWMVWMLFELIFYVFFSGGWMEVGNDSFLRLDATNDPVTGDLLLTPTADSTSVFKVTKADDAAVFNVDTTNEKVGVSDQIYHLGDTDTYLTFLTNRIAIVASGWSMIDCNYGGGQIIFNNSGKDINVIMEGTGDANLFSLDAANNAITIGSTTKLGKLAVDGNADEIQFAVQAHSTQNENIVEIQKSDGTTILSGADERGILFSDGGTVSSNLFIGDGAGSTGITSSHNIALGFSTLDAAGDARRNVAICGFALTDVTSGDENIAIGYNALGNITASSGNVAIGSSAGTTSTGSNNIFIGFNAGNKQAATSDSLIISNQTYADAATELTNSILYGQMAATPAAQTLRINAEILGSVGAKIGDGGTTNYTEIESDGTLQAFGTATAFDDIRVPLSSIKRLGFADPSWVQFADDGAASIGVYALSFSNTVDQEVYFSIQVPHNWKLGTDLDAHVHWSPSDTSTNSVTWKLEYTVSNINGTFGNTSTLSVTDAGDGTAKKHQYADLGNIDLSAYTANTDVSIMVMCRLYRDVSDGDDYAAGAFLLETDFHYEIDSLGSRSEMSK